VEERHLPLDSLRLKVILLRPLARLEDSEALLPQPVHLAQIPGQVVDCSAQNPRHLHSEEAVLLGAELEASAVAADLEATRIQRQQADLDHVTSISRSH
jgi:hypothetical protein